MAKTIALSDVVYEMLSKAKMKGESFSDVIRRLLKTQKISDIPKILDESRYYQRTHGKAERLTSKS